MNPFPLAPHVNKEKEKVDEQAKRWASSLTSLCNSIARTPSMYPFDAWTTADEESNDNRSNTPTIYKENLCHAANAGWHVYTFKSLYHPALYKRRIIFSAVPIDTITHSSFYTMLQKLA